MTTDNALRRALELARRLREEREATAASAIRNARAASGGPR